MIKLMGNDEHDIVQGWWDKHPDNVYKLPKDILPTGYIAYDGDKPVIATFIYGAEGYFFGFQAWTTANPDMDKYKRDKCFGPLMEFVEKDLKAKGITVLFASPSNASLMKRFNDIGYVTCDTDAVHMIKILK